MRMATAGATAMIRGGAEAISQHARPLRATRGQREASAGPLLVHAGPGSGSSEPLSQCVAQRAGRILGQRELAAAINVGVQLDLAAVLRDHQIGETHRACVHRTRRVDHFAALTGSLRRDIVGHLLTMRGVLTHPVSAQPHGTGIALRPSLTDCPPLIIGHLPPHSHGPPSWLLSAFENASMTTRSCLFW